MCLAVWCLLCFASAAFCRFVSSAITLLSSLRCVCWLPCPCVLQTPCYRHPRRAVTGAVGLACPCDIPLQAYVPCAAGKPLCEGCLLTWPAYPINHASTSKQGQAFWLNWLWPEITVMVGYFCFRSAIISRNAASCAAVKLSSIASSAAPPRPPHKLMPRLCLLRPLQWAPTLCSGHAVPTLPLREMMRE